MSKYINRARALFRSEAVTLGVSPKALAGVIGSALTALLALAGVTPADIAGALSVNVSVVAAAEVAIASTVAAFLLGPGSVAAVPASLTEGSDARLSDEANAQLPASPAALPEA